MIRQFCRDLPGAIAIEQLCLLSDSPVQVNSPRCGYPLIQHVLIQSMYKTVPAYRNSVWQYLDSGILNELTLASQFIGIFTSLYSVVRPLNWC
jgi:hypothetical protein